MTDKQIIIDEQMENLNNLATQQLKRIEEEKRQIEHIAKTHLVETFDMQREIDKLKKELQAKEQECDQLKAENLSLKRGIEIEKEADKSWISQLKAENDELKVQNIKYMNGNISYQLKNSLYKQTLAEIKEICKKESGWVNCSDNMPTETAIFAEQILQKISECEVK